MSLRGGRSLRRQIDAALSGEADPLGPDGLGLPDGPSTGDEFESPEDDADTTSASGASGAAGASAIARRGKSGRERRVDTEVRAAYVASQAARTAGAGPAGGAAGGQQEKPGAGSTSAGRRLPDLHVLPPLLHSSGAYQTLRTRLGTENVPLPHGGRHASLAAVPHGAKTFLAAAIATGGGRDASERLCWIARDAEIGDRVAE